MTVAATAYLVCVCVLCSFFLSSRYGPTSKSRRLLTSGCGRAGSAECITKGSRCIGVVLVKIEMNVSGSSWKSRDSLSPQLLEYLVEVFCFKDCA